MKKGILCILLSLLLVTPLFTACTQEADLTGTEASIYTLYTIVDESTTDEAINQVELALNRILFYRLGVILKLEMVTEDEYDQLIETKFAEMEEYEASKSDKKSNSSAAEGEGSQEVLTGDLILEMLENGEEIPLKNPRLDIFLVKGYDKYSELATEGKLAQLDEKLQNEAKAIKSSIHTTLFNAAKINNKTYGVPVNNAIGEYTYLAFDKELLEKYSVDPNTIKTIEDLQDYLELIKQNELDVVPLMNTLEATDINFLVNEGFPALVTSDGEVVEAYSNKNLQEYFSMLARYEALGYLAGEDADENARYAVRIEKGNTDDIDTRLADTGYEYTYSLYSNPIATNETTIDNIFCVSKYVVSNQLTDVMEILTALNTDDQLMNLLTYGVENEHYVLNDDGQVERLTDTYMIDPNHVGNSFITYTLEGENPDKWNYQIKQNQDAIASPSLGYTVALTEFEYTDEENNEVKIFEPNYVEIINTVVDKYYPALMSGTAFELDYQTILTEATDEVNKELTETLDAHYINNILKPMLNEQVREDVTKNNGPKILQDATNSIKSEYLKRVKSNLKKKLTTEFESANPDATEDEIDAMVEAQLTDAYVEANMSQYYTDEEIQEKIDEVYVTLLEQAISEAANKIVGSPEYDTMYKALMNSEDYKNDLNDMLMYDAPSKIQAKVDEKIVALVSEYTGTMIAEIETEIEAAVEAFIEENSAKLDLTRDEMLLQMGYLQETEEEAGAEDSTTDGDTSGEVSDGTSADASAEVSEESVESSAEESVEEPAEESVEEIASEAEVSEGDATEGEEGEEAATVITQKYETWFQFVLKEKITASYYSIFGDPNAAA